MITNAQIAETRPEDYAPKSTAFREDAKQSIRCSTREDTFVDVDKINQNGLPSDSKQEFKSVLSFPEIKTVPEWVSIPLNVLQEWEGYVQCVDDVKFTATLIDKTKKNNVIDEEADFSIDDLDENDKLLLKPGAVFRWLIGYRKIAGSKERISRIVFRHLPAWTARDLQSAQMKARHISRSIAWE